VGIGFADWGKEKVRLFPSPYKVIHNLPGRIRIHISLPPVLLPEFREFIADVLEALPEFFILGTSLQKISYSRHSGNVLVYFNEDLVGSKDILNWMEMLSREVLKHSWKFLKLQSEEKLQVSNRIIEHLRSHPIELSEEKEIRLPDEIWTA
jgi:hypothetical protein